MIKGKGMWVWMVSQLLTVYPSLADAVKDFVDKGFTHVEIKTSNGWYSWLPNTPEGRLIPEFLSLCRDAGLKIYQWSYSYAYSLSGETSAILKAWKAYGGDGFIIDAEMEYKRNGTGKFAMDLVSNVRPTLQCPIGYSTYRFPSLHQDFPYEDFTSVCDFAMPQVYWEGAHNPAEQLQRCVDEYALFSDLPLYPAGASYYNRGWQASSSEVIRFSDKAQELNLDAINYWRWDTALKIGVWDAIGTLDWGENGTQPPLTDKEKLDILWKMHTEGNHP